MASCAMKVFAHCCKKGIFLAHSTDRPVASDAIFKYIKGYGALGAVLRKNFIEEWQYSCITTSAANVHLIHLLSNNSHLTDNAEINKDVQKWIHDSSVVQSQSFGIAYVSNDSTQNCSEDNFCIDYYCMQSSQQDWLVHWQRKRLKWWKRFSKSPEKFILENNDKEKLLNIKYVSANDDQLLIERITSYDNITSNNTSLITINTKLDTGIWSILMDSFLDNNRQWSTKQGPNALLQIHRRLTPIKVAVLPQEDSEDQKLFSDRLTSELNLVNLTSCCFKEGTLETRLKHLDEIGTPTRVLLDENTLTNGVVYMQDRDSGLSEPIESESLLNAIQKMYQRFKDVT